jgi:mRNA interferase RelE/StbE
MKYKVEILPAVMKSLKNIDPKYVVKILKRIDFLEVDPRHNGSIKLSGNPNSYRTRVGRYRIIYKIYDEKVLVSVINVDHRKDIYR